MWMEAVRFLRQSVKTRKPKPNAKKEETYPDVRDFANFETHFL